MTVLKITTVNQDYLVSSHVYPPIPIRSFDWRVWVHGSDDEAMVAGVGSTLFFATLDLYMQWEEDPFTDNEPFVVHREGFWEDLGLDKDGHLIPSWLKGAY